MSDEQQGGSSSLTHPLTQALHPDPDRFGERATVVGYPGPSPQTGRVRVYLDPTFTSYYELDESAVLNSVASRADDENSPTVVVIASDAPVQVVRVQSGQTEARFLEGSITGGYLATAAAARTRGAVDAGGAGAGGAADCACVIASIVGVTIAGQQAAVTDGADCVCVGCSMIANTFAGQQAAVVGAPNAAQCMCIGTMIGNTFAGQQAAVVGAPNAAQCMCIGTMIGNTFAGQQAAVVGAPNAAQCMCIGTMIGNTFAGQQAARTGGAVPALQANICYWMGGTEVCTSPMDNTMICSVACP